MRFTKMHGLGNDFIVVDARDCADRHDWSALAQRWCDRRFGIGGDGLILVLPGESGDWRMRIINSDGSEPEMCGNGIRCFALWLRVNGLETRDTFVVDTLAGPITPTIVGADRVAVDMGEPRLAPAEIPITGCDGERVVRQLLEVGDDPFLVTCVSMGNPHCITFVDDVERVSVEWLGPQIERHPRVPRKTNVEFVQVLGRDELIMRVWERGAGRTLACGTGACATLVAAALNGLADRAATVHLEGGDLHIEWRESDNRVIMTGPATTAFTGEAAV